MNIENIRGNNLENNEIDRKMLSHLSMLKLKNALERKMYLKSQSKKLNLTSEEFKKKLNKVAIEIINNKEKVKHYHQTSLKNAKEVIESGGFLSRSEIIKRNPDKQIDEWSSSKNVMMTLDSYNKAGQLSNLGVSNKRSMSNKSGTTFVFNSRLFNLPSYDAINQYPEAESIPLQGVCEKILVEKESDILDIETTLRSHQLENIEVIIKEEYVNNLTEGKN